METYLSSLLLSAALIGPLTPLYTMEEDQGQHPSSQNKKTYTPISNEERERILALSFEDLKKEADQDYAPAQTYLGFIYSNGKGVPQNFTQAIKYYTLAAEQGFPTAQTYLGNMYGSGKGVPQNFTQAIKYYTLAANQGYAPAQYHLGLMYERGQGVERNLERFFFYAWQGINNPQKNINAGGTTFLKNFLTKNLKPIALAPSPEEIPLEIDLHPFHTTLDELIVKVALKAHLHGGGAMKKDVPSDFTSCPALPYGKMHDTLCTLKAKIDHICSLLNSPTFMLSCVTPSQDLLEHAKKTPLDKRFIFSHAFQNSSFVSLGKEGQDIDTFMSIVGDFKATIRNARGILSQEKVSQNPSLSHQQIKDETAFLVKLQGFLNTQVGQLFDYIEETALLRNQAFLEKYPFMKE